MTRILAMSSSKLAVHACDRLVSGDGVPYDRVANKTIVYAARDAVAFMSYTGSAYLENIPTDEWLARALVGEWETVAGPPGTSTGALTWSSTRHGRLPDWFDVGRAAQELQRQLEEVRSILAPDEWPPTVLISGVQWRRSRPEVWHPFLGCVEIAAPGARYEARFFEPLPTSQPFSICERPLPWLLTALEQDRLQVEVMRLGPAADPIERELVAAVRNAARRSPGTIGDEVMTASISANSANVIRIRFHSPRKSSMAVTRNSDGKREYVDVAFSPWIIGPTLAMPPQAVMGFHSIGLGSVEVGNGSFRPMTVEVVDAPQQRQGGRLVGVLQTADRKYSPRLQRKKIRRR
jgi:hypothetical protein